MEKKTLTDEEINKKVSDVLDNVIITGKESTRTIIDLLVEKLARSANEIFDKNIEQIKQKLKERLISNDKRTETTK